MADNQVDFNILIIVGFLYDEQNYTVEASPSRMMDEYPEKIDGADIKRRGEAPISTIRRPITPPPPAPLLPGSPAQIAA